jgi:hypothetical protein
VLLYAVLLEGIGPGASLTCSWSIPQLPTEASGSAVSIASGVALVRT